MNLTSHQEGLAPPCSARLLEKNALNFFMCYDYVMCSCIYQSAAICSDCLASEHA
jgi:hypothetical protein